MTSVTREDYRELARSCFEATLAGLADDESDEVLAEAQLGLMALHMLYGATQAIALVPTDIDEHINRGEPKCVCDPALAARGGYSSRCPASHPANPKG